MLYIVIHIQNVIQYNQTTAAWVQNYILLDDCLNPATLNHLLPSDLNVQKFQ